MSREAMIIILDLYSSTYLTSFAAGRRDPHAARPHDTEPASPSRRRFWSTLVIVAAAGLFLAVLFGVLPQNVTL